MNKTKSFVFCLMSFSIISVSHSDDLLNLLQGDEQSNQALVVESNDLVRSLSTMLPNKSAEQNIFLNFLSDSKYRKALFQWRSAFENTPFAESETGKALESYLFFKVGLPVVGLEHLFSIKEPKKIDTEIQKIWRIAAPIEHVAWGVARLSWDNVEWKNFFGNSIAVRVLSKMNSEDLDEERILALLKETKENSPDREILQWKMVLSLAVKKDFNKAVKVLSHLIKTSTGQVSKDLLNLTASRMLYENGFLQASIEYLEKIPKSSEYWFVAQEEIAWSYMRKAQVQDVLAVTRSLMPDLLDSLVGPETVFLRSIAQLKTCDYKGVSESLQEFKRRYRKRAANLSNTAANDNLDAIEFAIEQLKQGRLKRSSLSVHAEKLPRFTSRDERLYRLSQTQKSLEIEAKKVEELYASSMSEGSAEVGFQSLIAKLKEDVYQRVQSVRSSAISLLRERSQLELGELKTILQKMHIVEAEMLQQIQALNSMNLVENSKPRLKEVNKQGNTGDKGKYALKFAAGEDLWFDEIGNYRVDLQQACPAVGAR